MRRRPDYGIDAPSILTGYVAVGAGLLVAGVVAAVSGEPPSQLTRILHQGLWGGPVVLLGGAAHLWSSRVGKIREVRRMVAALPWRGDELVLDVGCGRGLALVEAAKRVPSGLAVGVDIWSTADQTGNRPGATLANAEAEGVLDRVRVVDGDARALPFVDGAFDVILSSAVLHNVHRRGERRRAVAEVVRALRPGGRAAILDIARTPEYAREMEARGMTSVARGRPVPLWLFPARTVTATKPAP